MKKQILIVEDENDCAELLRYHLQKEQYEAVVVRTGNEAVEAVRRRMPDAVLLDIMLPGLNGWEVCSMVREDVKGKTLPIIMLTALSDEEDRVRGLGLGADDYVAKPYSVKELLLKIRKHIDRQQTIKRLESREREQDSTLNYVVHELKNTLNMIGGFSSLALRKGGTDARMNAIHAAARHAESLLNDASLLTRIETGGSQLPIEPVDLHQLANEAIDLFQDEIQRINIEICPPSTRPAPVRGNKTAILQIIINLISNAVKYNREGGAVRVYFEEQGDFVAVSIQDEGRGIENADLTRIFDKFYRTAEGRRQKGAGLGLYIVKHLSEAMDGDVKVASRPGTGSTFTVTFTKAEAAALRPGRNVA